MAQRNIFLEEDEDSNPFDDAPPAVARQQRWLGIGKEQPPEDLAAHVESPQARWTVITEDGPEIKRLRRAAYLEDPLDLPYWAYALAKAYLDDVEEWPLFGLKADLGLEKYHTDHQDPIQAVHEILEAVTPVWPEFTVIDILQENRN